MQQVALKQNKKKKQTNTWCVSWKRKARGVKQKYWIHEPKRLEKGETSGNSCLLLTPVAHSLKNLLRSIRNKRKHKQEKHLAFPSFQHLFIHPSGVGCCSVWHSIPFCPISPTHKMFIAVSHWFGSSALLHHHHWNFTETRLQHPAVAPGHGDCAVIF